MSILVIGSVALDTVKTPYGIQREILGGSATYFSMSAKFFNPVNLVTIVGTDFPIKYIKLFREKGINLDGLVIRKGKTFRWEAEYDLDPNKVRTISTNLNVFKDFKPNIPKTYKKSKYIFLANIDPEIQDIILQQIEKPKLIALDTMNHWIENKRKFLIKLLKRIDIFFLNEVEAHLLSEENNLCKAANKIFKFGPKNIIIKKGENGALLFSSNSFFCIPAFLLEKVSDPTGAGDTFAGGVIGYLSKSRNINDKNLRKAIVYGTVLASFVVEEFGPSKLIAINWKDIQKRFNIFKNFISF